MKNLMLLLSFIIVCCTACNTDSSELQSDANEATSLRSSCSCSQTIIAHIDRGLDDDGCCVYDIIARVPNNDDIACPVVFEINGDFAIPTYTPSLKGYILRNVTACEGETINYALYVDNLFCATGSVSCGEVDKCDCGDAFIAHRELITKDPNCCTIQVVGSLINGDWDEDNCPASITINGQTVDYDYSSNNGMIFTRTVCSGEEIEYNFTVNGNDCPSRKASCQRLADSSFTPDFE